MPGTEYPPQPRSTRGAILAMFFVNGAGLATWLSMIPAVQQRLALTSGQLGVALLGLALGAVVAMPVTGWVVGHAGGRRVGTLSAVAYCATLAILPQAPTLPLLAATLLVFGAASGVLDVAMNVQGAEVEAIYGRPLMSTFHGFYSLGGFAGALLGSALAAAGLTPAIRALLAALALAAAALVGGYWLLPTQKRLKSRRPSEGLSLGTLSWALVALGVMAFCSFLAEGASGDWSALYLHRVLGTGPAVAATAYAAFSIAMAVGRLNGDWLTARLGAIVLLRAGGGLSAIGLAIALILGRPVVAIVGFGLVGLGLANIVPTLFSAAGRTRSGAPRVAIAAVAFAGYTGIVAGPPLIGFAAQAFTLTRALITVVACCLLIALLAPKVRYFDGRVGNTA